MRTGDQLSPVGGREWVEHGLVRATAQRTEPAGGPVPTGEWTGCRAVSCRCGDQLVGWGFDLPGKSDITLDAREGDGAAADQKPCFRWSGVSNLDRAQNTLFEWWNRDPLIVGFGTRGLVIDEYGFEVRLGGEMKSKRPSKCSAGERDSSRMVIEFGVDGRKSREHQHRDRSSRVISVGEGRN